MSRAAPLYAVAAGLAAAIVPAGLTLAEFPAGRP
jgi:hypothetical protein